MRNTYPILIGLLILSCILHATANAAFYYVKESGDDQASGLSDHHAWRTVAKVNGFKFFDGDTVSFKRGDRFTDATLSVRSVNNFTIRDYGSGPKPHINGDLVQPIRILPAEPMMNLTILNIDISGQDWHPSKHSNLIISNAVGLTLDGIVGNGHFNGNRSTGKTAIYVFDSRGPIVVRNCELRNWGPPVIPSPGRDIIGIALINISEGTYDIYNNFVANVNADCLHLYLNRAFGRVHHNQFLNGGENSIDVKGTSNCDIYNNIFYRTSSFRGSGGSGEGKVNYLIVVHGPGGSHASNNVIRNNHFLGGDSMGIRTAMADSTEIKFNFFEAIPGAINIGNPSTNTLVHHNLIINPNSQVLRRGDRDIGGISENNSGTGTKIYNNTVFNQSGNCNHLVVIDASAGSHLFRNVIYQGLSTPGSHALYSSSIGRPPIYQSNCWYKTGGQRITNYAGRTYSRHHLSSWRAAGFFDLFSDPLFQDPEKRDFSLSPASPCRTGDEPWGACTAPMLQGITGDRSFSPDFLQPSFAR